MTSSSFSMGMVIGFSLTLSKMNHLPQLLDLFVQLKRQMTLESVCAPASSSTPLVTSLSFKFQIRNLGGCSIRLRLSLSVFRFLL